MAKKPRQKPQISQKIEPLAPPGIATISWVATMTAIGLLIWAAVGNGRGIGWIRWVLIGSAAFAAAIPDAAGRISAMLDRVRRPSRRATRRAAMLIGFVAAAYFVLTAINQNRDLFPKTHDDCSYAIGMQMLARGRLWEPPLPCPDFFDSFYLLVRPVYCSLYFPGTALLYVPSVWLHLPDWLMPAMASGAVVAMMYLIATELIDGAAGLLAALIVISLSWFRVYSVLLTSHVPMLLMALLLFWAWLRWREGHRLRWAMAMGIFAGWGAITRPADAVIFALPVGACVLWEIVRHRNWRTMLAPLAIIAAAAPFLAVQIIFDVGVTGHALQAPYTYYLEQDQPGSSFGFHPYSPAARPQSPLLQKQENYDRWVRPYLARHTLGQIPKTWATQYFPELADTALPCRLMFVFMAIGLLGLVDVRRWILWLTFPIFLLIYALNPFFLEHYAILLIPAATLATLLGGEKLASAWPARRGQIASAFTAVVFVACVTGLWEVNRFVATKRLAPNASAQANQDVNEVSDETFPSAYLHNIHLYLTDLVDQPAVVLFTYHPGDNFFEEPVYNTDVAWPDDAPVIRAHDLGLPRNREIFAYYAKTQPDRRFYIFDWSLRDTSKKVVRELGTARELAAKYPVP